MCDLEENDSILCESKETQEGDGEDSVKGSANNSSKVSAAIKSLFARNPSNHKPVIEQNE
jgi:hypothetical protein